MKITVLVESIDTGFWKHWLIALSNALKKLLGDKFYAVKAFEGYYRICY